MSASALPANIVFHQAILYKISYSATINLEFRGRYFGGISATPQILQGKFIRRRLTTAYLKVSI